MNIKAVDWIVGSVLLIVAASLLVPAMVGAGCGEVHEAAACLWSAGVVGRLEFYPSSSPAFPGTTPRRMHPPWHPKHFFNGWGVGLHAWQSHLRACLSDPIRHVTPDTRLAGVPFCSNNLSRSGEG
jgi:hypothetical protein